MMSIILFFLVICAPFFGSLASLTVKPEEKIFEKFSFIRRDAGVV